LLVAELARTASELRTAAERLANWRPSSGSTSTDQLSLCGFARYSAIRGRDEHAAANPPAALLDEAVTEIVDLMPDSTW